MKMNRRTALGGIAASALAGPALARAQNRPKGHLPPKPEIEGGALINKDRAWSVMEQYGLAGIIALDPINVYYMTNVRTIGVRFITEYPGFATMSPDPDMPIYLVSGSSAAWGHRQPGPGDRRTHALRLRRMERGGVQHRRNAARAHGRRHPPLPLSRRCGADAARAALEGGLGQLPRRHRGQRRLGAGPARLKAQGITRGRVAVDDMRIARFLAQTDLPDVECVDGYGVLQLIRMVKTPQELAYQKLGELEQRRSLHGHDQRTGAPACAYRRGADLPVRVRHPRQPRQQTSSPACPAATSPTTACCVPGKPYLIDCVSNYKGYMGDIARTFFIGDPPKEVEMRRRANQLAREAVFDAIRRA